MSFSPLSSYFELVKFDSNHTFLPFNMHQNPPPHLTLLFNMKSSDSSQIPYLGLITSSVRSKSHKSLHSPFQRNHIFHYSSKIFREGFEWISTIQILVLTIDKVSRNGHKASFTTWISTWKISKNDCPMLSVCLLSGSQTSPGRQIGYR